VNAWLLSSVTVAQNVSYSRSIMHINCGVG
jgi:hypothetical protein